MTGLAFGVPGGDGHPFNGALIGSVLMIVICAGWLLLKAAIWAGLHLRSWRGGRRLIAEVKNPESDLWAGNREGRADG